jgi:hypothetical protein
MDAVKAAESLQGVYRSGVAADLEVEAMDQSLVSHLEVGNRSSGLPFAVGESQLA